MILSLAALLALAGATIVSLLGLSAASIVFPDLGNLIWAGVFLLAAYFVPEVILYKTKRVTLTMKSIFGLLGVGIIMFSLVKMQLPSFFGAFALPVVGATGLEGIAEQLAFWGIEPASFGAVAIVIVGTITGALILDKAIYKRKLFKKRR